ncbi:hypothetical protein NPIL_469171 [Nephila pilipes]|uniref:Uncharacterized protein n=1 Tax=Nephila pilipes TaxID=299642 RepID=A0A8X6Q788_NEPPI|nr:hypothetical protein NPIL_469171 [Nephila pilipes]
MNSDLSIPFNPNDDAFADEKAVEFCSTISLLEKQINSNDQKILYLKSIIAIEEDPNSDAFPETAEEVLHLETSQTTLKAISYKTVSSNLSFADAAKNKHQMEPLNGRSIETETLKNSEPEQTHKQRNHPPKANINSTPKTHDIFAAIKELKNLFNLFPNLIETTFRMSQTQDRFKKADICYAGFYSD